MKFSCHSSPLFRHKKTISACDLIYPLCNRDDISASQDVYCQASFEIIAWLFGACYMFMMALVLKLYLHLRSADLNYLYTTDPRPQFVSPRGSRTQFDGVEDEVEQCCGCSYQSIIEELRLMVC